MKNQCSVCGKYESGPVGTPEGWFGVDEEGNSICDDCRDLREFRELKQKQREAAKKTNETLKKKNPNHYKEAGKKRWAHRKN